MEKQNFLGESTSKIEVKKDVPILGVILIILMLVIVMSLFIYYLKFSRKDQTERKVVISVIAVILLGILLFFTVRIFNTQKNPDVNKDNEVTYDDAKEIMDYLLEIKNVQDDESIKDKDLNNDGKITVTDVAKATEEATDQKYTGSITSPTQENNNGSGTQENKPHNPENPSNPSKPDNPNNPENPSKPDTPQEPDTPIKPENPNYETEIGGSLVSNFTPKKGEEITINLNIDLTPYTQVEFVIINGIKYPVKKGEGNNYSVTIPAPQKAGVQDIVIEGVVLDNGKEVEAEYKITVDVLKDKPEISNFVIDTQKQIPQLTVNIKDNDSAIKSSKVIVTDEQGNVVFQSDELLSNQDNIFALNGLEKDKKYNVKVEVTYDLDSDASGNPEDNRHTDVIFSRDFTLSADYGFEGSNYTITEKVTKEDKVIVQFENAYNSYYDVEYVIIDGNKYKVTKNGNVYQVELEKGKKGKNSIVIEEVLLENGAKYQVNKQLDYVYLKDIPVISGVEVEFKGSKVTVSFDSQDEDNTIKDVKVYLTDENGNIIDEKTLKPNETLAEFDVNEEGSYKVKVETTYDLGDGQERTTVVEYENVVKQLLQVSITDCKYNKYVEKGQLIEVSYVIETNTSDTISSIVVNGVTLPAIKNGDGTYTVKFNVPTSYGKAELNVNKVIFENEGEVDVTYNCEYEVLKSMKPIVEGISVVEKENKATLAFNILDEEDTFVSGRIVVKNTETDESYEISFNSVTDTVHELKNIKEFQNYSVEVYITYDLDTDKLDKANQKEELLGNKEFELIGDFEFNFSDLKVKNVDRQKNVVVLQFNASLAQEASDNYSLKEVMINGVAYQVVLDSNTVYTVEVPFTSPDRQELIVQEAILNNSQGFAITENNKVLVFKDKPEAIVRSTVERELVDGLRKITASLQLNDKDNTIVKGTLCAKLVDAKGNIIDKISLTENSTEIVFRSQKIYDAGTYTVEVYSDYDLIDGLEHKEEKIGEGKATVAIYATIEDARINKYYVQKGEQLQITYTVSSNTQENVSGVIVNGENIAVTKNEDGTYTANVVAPDKYGTFVYDTTRLVYTSNEQQTSATNTLKVDVLRTVKPSISELSINDEDADKPLLKFKILDDEETFVKGKVIITDKQTQEKQEIEFSSKEDTTFELKDIKSLNEYNVEVEITYDFDSDKTDTTNQTTETLANSVFSIIKDYNFTLENFKLVKVDTQNKLIEVSFESGNSSQYVVNKAYINGIEYDVTTQEDNVYTVQIPYNDETRQELVLEKVELENLKEFDNLQQDSILVFKYIPTTQLNLTLNDEKNSINATFSIVDLDSIVTGRYARLLKADGSVTETKSMDEFAKNVEFTSEEPFKAGEYTVQILADFDRVDGKIHNQEVIATANVTVPSNITVTSFNSEKYYVNKDDILKLIFEISSNKEESVQTVKVNGVISTPRKISDNKYEISVNTPDIAGIYEYSLEEIVFEDEETISVNNTEKVDVLKNTVPTVSGVAITTQNVDKPVLSFIVSDDEETFVAGRIVITNTENKKSQQITFDSLDKLEFELSDVEEFTNYEVEIFVTYDLDSNKGDTENQQEQSLEKENFEVIGEYDFSLSNLRVQKVDLDREVIILEFDSTNALEDNYGHQDYYVKSVIINDVAYDIKSKDQDTYTVEVPYTQEVRTELVLQKAILNNLQEFTVDKENSVVVFKSLSAIAIATVQQDNKSISVDVKFIDNDNTLQSAYIVLLDGQGRELSRQSIDGDYVATFNLDEGYTAGNYSAQVVATFDIVDGREHKDEVIATATTSVLPTVTIISSKSEEYVKKDGQVQITYTLDTNTDVDVDTIVVNDIAYNAEKVSENVYKVNVKAPKEAGVTDFKVTRVNFKDENTAQTEYTSQIEVLKSILPTISELVVDDTNDNPVLSFTVIDEEDTFVSGKIIITDTEKGDTTQIPFASKENTSFALSNIEKFKKYNVDIYITYDLDTNNDYTGNQDTEVIKDSFELFGDYKFTLDNLIVKSIDRQRNVAILEFVSTNASEDNDEYSDYYVKEVEINGQIYTVSKEGTTYTVEVPYTSETRTELVLQKAILDNLKEFTDLTNKVVIFKDKPSANIEARVEDEQKTIISDITITDNDEALLDLTAKLVNPKGEVIETVDIDNDEKTVSFKSLEGGIFKAGEYRVELYADYDIKDGITRTEKELIGYTTVKIATKASITSAQVVNYYVEKGGNVEIKYTFTSNNDNAPTGVNVENSLYSLTANDDGTYTASIPAISSGYGVTKQTVSVAMYGEETVTLDSTVDAQYYLLKAKPVIQNFKFNEFSNNQTITFNFIDSEDAIIQKATMVILDEMGEEVKSYDIVKGENTIQLQELSNGKYKVQVKGSYDLDDDKENEQNNYYLSDIFAEQEINVISDYEAKINIENVVVDTENNQVVLTLESNNIAGYETKFVIIDEKEYEAVLENGKYTVKIPYEKAEHTNYTITGVKVENDIELELAQEKTFEIFKATPSANVEVKVSEDNKKITATFSLTDENKAIKSLCARLLDKDNQVVETKEIDSTLTSVEFVCSDNGIFKAKQYTVEIGADYELFDGSTHNSKETIGSNTTQVDIQATVISDTASKYVNKNTNLKIVYEISSNTSEELSSIVVNGKELPATKLENNKYEVEYTSSKDFGEEVLKVETLKYSKDVKVTYQSEIYVLKDIPTITNYSFNDEYKNEVITFDFADADKAMIQNAQVILYDTDKKLNVIQRDVQEGTNTIELNDLDNDTYTLKIEGNYDLDEDNGNSLNEGNLSQIFEPREIKFIKDYQLKFDIKNVEVLRDSNNVKLTLESSNVANYPLSYVVVNGNNYPVVIEDGVTYVLIPYEAQENQNITISNVILQNGVTLSVENASVEIFKGAPKVENFSIDVNENDITVNFKVTDEENIMKNAKILLVDFKGQTVKEQEITSEFTSVEFKDIEKAGSYTVKIVADYDSVDGLEHKAEVLKEETTSITIIARVEKDSKNDYANKNSTLEVTYTITSNTDEKVTKIKINDIEYDASETEDGKYKVEYKTSSQAGDETLKVTELKYQNDEVVSVEYSSTVEILKDKLTISEFKVDTTSEKAKVTYTVNDPDNSFVSGRIIIKNVKDETETEMAISKDKSEYELELLDLNTYNIMLEITYDLDKEADNNLNKTTEVLANEDNVEFIKDYKLEISDLTVVEVERDVLFNAKLQFKSTNASIYDVYSVTIDGKEHEVYKADTLDNTYEFEYPYTKDGLDKRKEITITAITLTNNKKLELSDNLSVVIFKNHPVAENIELENIENTKIKATFKVTDEDKTLTSLYAVLKNELDETIVEEELAIDASEVEFNVMQSGVHKVEIRADYEAVDGLTHTDELLATSNSSVEVKPEVTIATNNISEKYPEKNETIEITYQIESNTMKTPTKVVLNEKEEYVLTPVDESSNLFKISYTASDNSQIENLKVTNVYFGDELGVEVTNFEADIIEVLKTIPTITITSTDILEQNAVAFVITVNDPDGAMTTGNAVVHDQEKILTQGQNNFIVTNIHPDEDHVLNVKVKYDLDYNTIEEGQNEGTVTKDQEFRLVSDYSLTIKDLMTFDKTGKEETYFDKSEQFELRFNSDNKTSLVPEKVTVQDMKNPESKGIEYNVNSVQEGSQHKYYVDIVANSEAGEQEFKIISVTLDGSRMIAEEDFKSENPTATIEVMKAIPTISDFVVNNHENSVTVEFNIKDDDNALKESYVILTNKDDGSQIGKEKVKNGKNTHTFDNLTPGQKYMVKVENNYAVTKNGQVQNDVFKEQEIEITKKEESNFKAKNLAITKRVKAGSNVVITFENSLMSYIDVDTIVIDGTDYTVSKGDNGIYRLSLEPKDKGINKLHVDMVKIQDKEFEIDRNLSYVYEFAEPVAKNVTEISEDTSTSEAVITYNLEDKDNSVVGLTAYMKNSAGSVIATKTIELDEEETKTVRMDLRKVSTYSIELKANCDIGDGATFEEKTLFEQKKETKPRVTIVSQEIDKEYVEKGENVTLTFKINTNVDQEVKKISIGDESYKVTKVTKDGKVVDDTYLITVQAPNETGVFEQRIASIQIGSSLVDQIVYPGDMEPVNIKVFKQRPTISHFIIDEKNNKLSFNVNDPDSSLVSPYPSFVVKQGESELHTEQLNKGEAKYEYNLDTIKMTGTQNEYNVAIDVTYDLRPDAKHEQSILQQLFSAIANDDTPSDEEEDPNAKYIVTENIFNENYKLTGDIEYNLKFNAGLVGPFTLGDYQAFFFECSTGTEYQVSKVIIDGREYSVECCKDNGDGTKDYTGYYKAFSAEQDHITFEKVILENGVALDIPHNDGYSWCMIVQTDPTFVIKDFIEDIDKETVTFKYKLVDNDGKLATNLTFTLMNSQGGVIGTQEINPKDTDTVEFKVPYPPTSVYKLQVSGSLYEIPGYTGWLRPWIPISDEFQSSVNTSILSSTIENKYPNKNETFAIDYVISSTKVIIIDKEDHTNQNKAVGITTLVINGKDYDVQALEDKSETYRIYYTAKEDEGIEDIVVTQIKFSNGDVEQFNHEDQVEVLKTTPYITDFKTVNKLAEGKIEATFVVNDPDGVISTDNIKAKLGEEEKTITTGSNTVEFNVNTDTLLDFQILATFDLDDNKLKDETNANYNTYTDYPIFERKVMLTGDYNVTFSNVSTFNSQSKETNYFEKNEDIKLVFDCVTREKDLYPEKIKIDSQEYSISKVPETENTYAVTIPGSNEAKKISAKIEEVTLNSGNVVTIENQKVDYEILKDNVKVTDFKYSILTSDADTIELNINVEDLDNANKKTRVEIIDEYGAKITTSKDILDIGANNITFKKTEAEKYTVSVYSTYDRDLDEANEQNYLNDVRIHNQIVSLTTRYIEMKDIVDIKLYTFDELGNAVRVDSLTEDNINVVENCLVEVSMKTISTFYSKVTSYKVEGTKLKLVLAYTDAMVYTGEDELKPLEVTLDILENTQEYEYSGSFKSLVENMRTHNTKDYVINLDKDYDISDYVIPDNQKAVIDFDYKGTINGNGHTISNLTKPLFKKLDGAKIENLNIKGIVFNGSGDGKGVIATTATNGTTISNVHVENLVSPGNSTAGMVFELSKNSTIEKCSAINLTFNTSYVSQSVAPCVVNMKDNSSIKNCYVQGTISSGWWHNSGFVVDTDSTCSVENNIVNMKMSAYYALTDNAYGHGCGGIVCSDLNNGKTGNQGLTLKNNLSLVVGNAGVGAIYNPKRATLSNNSQNNYQLETAVVKHDESNAVKTIKEEEINAQFFRNDIQLDEEIWNIPEDASISNLPTLKGVSVAYSDQGKQPKNSGIYIPDYKRVSELQSYQEDREITYHNMYKLMPFYDAKEIIRDGNKIPTENLLTQKVIKYVVPFNKEGKMVSSLTTQNYNSLDKIYIVFEDGTRLEYNIAYDDYYGNVVSYMIPELNIGYNYNKYIVDPNQDSVRKLIEVASKYDFKQDLDPVTTSIEEDSRLYKEHYDNYTKYHIEEFVINTLVNMGYSPNIESDVYDDIIEREIINSGKLKKLLFAYNYFTYWYNLDMDGINLADSVMFNSSEMFDKDMTMEYLTEQLVQGTNSATNGTAGFYNNYFVKYTRLSNLGYYLDYYVTTLTHYDSGIEWFKSNFKGGYYYDINVENSQGLDYTIWDHLKKDGKVQTNFLPLMTVPENSMYVMSSPTQAYFGSLRVYMKDPNDQKQIDAFKAKVDVWLKEVQSFYTFAYDYWGKDTMNKYCDTNYDMRYTYTGVGDITVYNNPLTTEEPYHKYFAEAIGRWPATHGGAYANGNEVFWAVIKMLDNFRVGTHETLHNQDSKIFLNGYGRRGDAEDYAAGFIQQYYRDGWVSPNIFDEELVNGNTTQNMHKSTVSTDKKLHDYYNNYFRVNDFLDWIEAQAYFTLTAEQKASISVQVSYPEVSEDKQDEGDDVVAYTPLTTDMVEGMELKEMKDLWKNKIMLRPGVKKYERRSPGADTDSIFNIHWYQPHADNNRPDGANFKYLAWQMAGEGGYYEGLVPYYSLSYIGKVNGTGEKTTDLIALRYITKDQTMTYERYKLERYEELSKHYNEVGTYIDGQQIYKEYLEALQTDANNKDRNLTQSTAVKRKYFQQIRQDTNDFTIEPFEHKAQAASLEEEVPIEIESIKEVTSAQDLINLISENTNVTLKLGQDIDLSEYVDGEAIIDTEFSGTLDGNGFRITGSKLPIFKSLKDATVENLNITDCMINTDLDNIGVLSKTITNSTITNVIIENSIVKAGNYVGGIAGIVDSSILEDVHIKNVEITAGENTGGLAGNIINNTNIKQTSVNATVNSDKTNVGTFVGKVDNSEINNSYAVGKLVNKSDTQKDYIGGFVGYADNAVLQNNFVKVDMDTPKNSGGFVGKVVNTMKISNNLSLSNLTNNGYKFDGMTEDEILFSTDETCEYSNNYELSNTQGIETAQRNSKITSVITSIDISELTNDFFETKLHYSIKLWELSQLDNGQLPKLKNNDPNKELKLFDGEIEKAEEIDEVEEIVEPSENNNTLVENNVPENNTKVENVVTQEETENEVKTENVISQESNNTVNENNVVEENTENKIEEENVNTVTEENIVKPSNTISNEVVKNEMPFITKEKHEDENNVVVPEKEE